jgi:hypothetical protein
VHESNPHGPSTVYSTTICMLRIGGRLTVAASAALAVSLLILLTLNSPAPPSSSGAEPVTGGQMLGTQAITTNELARQVKAGEISSIVVLGGHAVATTVDSHPFTFTVVRGGSVLQQLQSLGVTPDELSRVNYVTGQPPLDGAPGTVPIIGVPLVEGVCGPQAARARADHQPIGRVGDQAGRRSTAVRMGIGRSYRRGARGSPVTFRISCSSSVSCSRSASASASS